MTRKKLFFVNPGWRILLTDLGIRPANVLRLADLPDDMFTREHAALNTDEYFRLWRGIELEANDPCLPIKIGQATPPKAPAPPCRATTDYPMAWGTY